MNTPVWQPKHPELSRMRQFMQFIAQSHSVKLAHYAQLHEWSITHPALFWQAIVDYFAINFTKPADQVLNDYQHMLDARWFAGAEFNFAGQLLKRNDDHPALVSIGEDGQRRVLSYRQLRQKVASCAQALTELGVSKGDRVAAIMPNVDYTVIAMLASSCIGATWSSCSADFGAQAAVDRIGQIDPKVLFCCNGHQYMGKKHQSAPKITQVQRAMPTVEKIVICPTIDAPFDIDNIPNAVWWDDFLIAREDCEFTSVPFAHPQYILFSSGTTGKPKCIIHSAGGTLLQHLKELALHCDLSEQDNLCFYTTCGWMMWNWMVSVLALGATLTLYEGSPTYPDVYRLFQLIEAEQITVFGTSPKFLSSVEKAGAKPREHYLMPRLKTILSTGAPLLPKNYDFVYEQLKNDVQLSSIAGGTDIISCFALGNPISPVYRGELQCLGLGMAVAVYNDAGQPLHQQRGELVCTQAFPSMPVGFWHDPQKNAYCRAYFDRFSGIWAHGDYAEITEHNGLIIYGRSDTVLNPGGVRIGTAEIYRQVEKITEVLESVVIGQDWEDDVRVVLFVLLQEGKILDESLAQLIRQTIRNNASPRHVPAKILQVPDIPRTISGKVVEVAVRQVVHGQTVSNLQSLANPEALEYFKNRSELQS